jgi:hypothetical protein
MINIPPNQVKGGQTNCAALDRHSFESIYICMKLEERMAPCLL